jgi:hypothetical protein
MFKSNYLKSGAFIAGILFVSLVLMPVSYAQFTSGSDGSDGALYVPGTSGTLTVDMPIDGIFNFTTVTIKNGAKLKFNRNNLNTPVYILATGDVLIEGQINVSGSSGFSSPPMGGLGGPGAFDGGAPGILGVPPGDGHGPGGGKGGKNSDPNKSDSAGAGSYGGVPSSGTYDWSASDGVAYGSPLLVPLVGGSGGAGTTGQPGRGGGGGGGAVLIASDTRIDLTSGGSVSSTGGSNSAQPRSPAQGSGGAVRLVAPVVAGSGSINVSGGYTSEYYGSMGGHGRCRIDTLDRRNLSLDITPVSSASVGSYMAVFPSPYPHLDIIHAAGQDIAEGVGSAVQIILPFDDPTTQTITIQASNFKGIVPITIVVHPENGTPVKYDTEIDMGGNSKAQISEDVQIPKNTITFIYVWTR